MRWRTALVGVLFALAATGAWAQPKLVFRIDSASAVIAHGRLIVTAHGAVKTGGWTHPALRLRRDGERDRVQLDFAATPPRSAKTVIQAVLPIAARFDVPAPRGRVEQVQLYSETNSVVIPVTLGALRTDDSYAASATTRLRPERLAR